MWSVTVSSTAVSDELLVIRPSTDQYKRTLKATPVLVLIVVGWTVLRDPVLGLATIVGSTGIGMGSAFLYLHRARIIVTPGELIRVGMVGRRSWPRTAIATVVSALIVQEG